jgi:hypothetical protein
VCDLLIIECALANDNLKMKGHLTPNEVIKIMNNPSPPNVDIEVIEAEDFLRIKI